MSTDHRLYQCSKTSFKISLHRLNDGYRDCPHGDDERNTKQTAVRPYRYRCQTIPFPFQFVSYQQLGNGIEECPGGTDELSRSTRWTFFQCHASDAYACWLFRNNPHDLSSAVLPYNRHCDTVWDTLHGQDEKNCSKWICVQGEEQCRGTGQCIQKKDRCDGEFDCSNGEDELDCPFKSRQWAKEQECNSTNELFCFTPEYLSNPRSRLRPCLSAMKIGDGHIDCLGGRDERNTFVCSDRQMLGDRFICDQQKNCLPYSSICFWNRTKCSQEQFVCANGTGCRQRGCNTGTDCPDRSNRFWCPNPAHSLSLNYRSTKGQRNFSRYESSCSNRMISTSFSQFSSFVRPSATSSVPSIRTAHCFCPPSYYGDRCQLYRRRMTLLLHFDRWIRQEIPWSIDVLVTLVHYKTRIVDHQFFLGIVRDQSYKHHLYLLYPSPRLAGSYSIELLSLGEYSLSPLEFLPVFRLAKVLRFPSVLRPLQCRENHCRNNGTCYRTPSEHSICLCLCLPEWHGQLGEKQSRPSRCAPNLLVRDENICIYPR